MALVPYCKSVTVYSFPSTAKEEMAPSDTPTVDDWREEQCRDKTISRVISIMRDNFRPRGERIRREPLQVQKFLRVYKKLILVDGVLYKTSSHDGQQVRLFVLPSSMRDVTLQSIHDDLRHSGKDKTLYLARQRYYWPGMEQDILKKCGNL